MSTVETTTNKVTFSTTDDSFAQPANERALVAAAAALEQHGMSVEIVDTLDAAREAVLARIPEGASVITNTSVTLQETGIAAAINESGRYGSVRKRVVALGPAPQAQTMNAIRAQAEYALGSVHAVTSDGALVLASATGSQLASYAFGTSHVILVVGAQKLVPDLQAAYKRIYEHCSELEDARAMAAYGQHSSVGKILEIHQERPGRIHVVLVRQVVGF